MDNFTQTIKNLLKAIKLKISTKADLNTDNTFKGNINIDKILRVKNNQGEFVDILDLINSINTKSHIHENISNLELIKDTMINGSKNLIYNNELYQKKFPHELNSEILSKFTYVENILYYDGIKILDPDTLPQKSYNINEKVTESKLVEINFSTITTENRVMAITNSELILTNKFSDKDLSVKISNSNIDGVSETLIPPSKTHIYSTGINKNTIIRIEGIFDYSFTMNYFKEEVIE